jgi:hypothetical protein
MDGIMSKTLAFILVILSAACLYIAVLSQFQVSQYEGKLKSFEVLLSETNQKNQSLHEEDLVILRLIDEQNKLIKAQDDKIRIQDANIAEARAKRKNK